MKIHHKWHTFIKWSLGLHGILHVAEAFLNIYEKAYYSACLSLLSSMLMLSGAFIQSSTQLENLNEISKTS